MNSLSLTWTLSELLPELGCLHKTEVTGLSQDSRSTKPGDLFIARRGLKTTGAEFAADAVAKGAVAVLLDASQAEAEHLQSILNVPVIAWITKRLGLGVLADRFYHSPSRKLKVVGITGTNGKTSSAHFCVQALEHLGRRTALIGTLGNGFLTNLSDASHTTPDAVDLHRMLAEFLAQGAEAVVMEVSSHAIDQGRIEGVEFDVVGYTNLTRDHLDYHGTEAAYAAAKARLFNEYNVGRQVLNADDPRPATILASIRHGLDRIGFSLTDQSQVVALISKELHPSGMRLQIKLGAQRFELESSLLGEFNIANLLLVSGLLLQLGYPVDTISTALNALEPVTGRMQRISSQQGPTVLVDYAHTPDALEKALAACRAHLTEGQLFVLFGCGGDRDRGKRPMMAAAAEDGSDRVWLTSDNPRNEDPQKILEDTLAGFENPEQVTTEIDRKRAIESVISAATAADIVLLAGKGHESYQEIKGERLPFSDAEVALQVLSAGERT